VNLPISSSTKVNLGVHIPHHRTSVHIEKHDPHKVSVSNPLALTAQEHAFIEETMAKGRETSKKQRAKAFYQNTRIQLLQRMQNLKTQKMKEQHEVAEKIRQLLSDTIEFSQKTAMAAKKALKGSSGSQDSENEGEGDLSLNEDKSSRSGNTGGKHNVIRNLVGATTPHDKKSNMSSPDHHKG
jgi:hypothetical protein